MSCALSQKFAPDTPLRHRFLVGYDVTDEIFGIAIARPGSLDPYYNYGAMLVAMPGLGRRHRSGDSGRRRAASAGGQCPERGSLRHGSWR